MVEVHLFVQPHEEDELFVVVDDHHRHHNSVRERLLFVGECVTFARATDSQSNRRLVIS